MNAPLLIVYGVSLVFQNTHFGAPAGPRPPMSRGNAAILPGGRIISPRGIQLTAGPGTFGLSISPAGKILTANIGPERLSLTVMEKEKRGTWLIHNLLTAHPGKSSVTYQSKSEKEDGDWRSVFIGTVFAGEKSAWIAEGNSGRIRLIDLAAGNRRHTIDLNVNGFSDSFTGDLIADDERGLLYVTDQTNFRVAIIDTKRLRILASIKTGRIPFALALSEDKKTLYVTHVGVFEYKAIPGADRARPAETGLRFPAYSFPSPEAIAGRKEGDKDIPALGDPNSTEANSLAVINVEDSAAPKLVAQIRTGRPFGPDRPGGSAPSGVAVGNGQVYVSNAHDDSVTIIDAKTLKIVEDLNIRIPNLESLRGVMPLGMTVDPKTGNVLVACAGINAVGVLNFKEKRLSFIPVGWFPTRVVLRDGVVYVSNAKGHGTGPNSYFRNLLSLDMDEMMDVLRRGSVSVFPLPDGDDLRKDSQTVLSINGFIPISGPSLPLPKEIRHVVLIVKENRTFDEVFGDIAGAPKLARFGAAGFADGGHARLSVKEVNITPNHHAIAQTWMMSDNFYADSEVSVDGHHWLVGNYPDAWTESSLMAAYAGQKDFRFPTTAPGRLLFAGSDSSVHPEEIEEAGTIWHHFARNGISFRNFGEGFELAGVVEGEGLKPFGVSYLTNVPAPDVLIQNSSRDYPGFNMNIPDQFRAGQFIHEIQNLYEKPGKDLPQFIYIHLPNDHMTKPRPEDGYPFGASYVADNDYALGSIVEYLSNSPWWKEMAIFVTEDDAQGGVDHVDSHRTVLLGISPWIKRGYVSHTNTSFPGLLKTVFRLLGAPQLNLYDAAASDLSEAFTTEPDFAPYRVLAEDPRVFVPENAREPKDPKPSVKMDSRPER
jgi:DNA-binding beta-propeller fold protein YncE